MGREGIQRTTHRTGAREHMGEWLVIEVTRVNEQYLELVVESQLTESHKGGPGGCHSHSVEQLQWALVTYHLNETVDAMLVAGGE